MTIGRFLTPFALGALMQLSLLAGTSKGQIDEDWVVFQDPLTSELCDVVNASNAELIVLFDSGTMVVVSGPDRAIEDLIVNEDNEVAYLGDPAGFLEYFDDGDGLPAVFWTSANGTVVGIDTENGAPFDSGQLAEEFVDTGCDACELIDESPLCVNDDNGPGGLAGLCGASAGGSAALSASLVSLLGKRGRRRRTTPPTV